jgi:hypothetical protein
MKRAIVYLALVTTLATGCSGPSAVPDDTAARELAAVKAAHAEEVAELKHKIAGLDSQLQDLKLRSDELSKANDTLAKNNERLTSIGDALHLKTASLLKNLPAEGLTEADLLYLLIYALSHGDAERLNGLFSRRFLAQIQGGKYPPFGSNRLTGIAVYQESFSPGSSTNIIEFTVETDDGPFWKGQHVFFPRFVREQGQLKIDALPTSPH